VRQFSHACCAVDNSDPGTDASQAIAKFVQDGVTTVLYLGGTESKFSDAAGKVGYYPEIVLAGDLSNDNNFAATTQDQTVWKNAWGESEQLRTDVRQSEPAYQAAYEGNPNLSASAGAAASDFYQDIFMTFVGIQIAGPRLTPQSVSQGFHAIPSKQSTNPYVASCFFDPNDFTCVKDAMEVWWNPSGQRQGSNQPGCWEMALGGKRYLPDKWPGGDDAFNLNDSSCVGEGGVILIKEA
jgi:hypothetical protein